MPKKTKKLAEERAKELGIPTSHIVKTEKGYYIAPASLKTAAARKIYAENRARGKSAEYSARVANVIEKNRKRK